MEQTIKSDKNIEEANILYTVAMRGLVAFPKMVMHFDVSRSKSMAAVERSLKEGGKLFLVTQHEAYIENPKASDLYKVGVVAEIKQVLKLPDNIMKVLVEGVYKANLVRLIDDGEVLKAEVKRTPTYSRAKVDEVEAEALMRSVKDVFERYASFFPRMPKELLTSIMTQDSPIKLFETVTFNCNLNYRDKQTLLEETNVINKLSVLFACLTSEVEILELENLINEQTKNSIDKGQREFYLREQLRVIQEQLGEDEGEEAFGYINDIMELKLDEKSKEKLLKEADKLTKLPPSSQEAFVIKNYLDTVLDLPWGKYTKAKLSMEKAETVLEKDHYGLKKVKERILEFLAVYMLNPEIKGQIICLAGPPGIGKTSIAKSIAKAMGRKYARVSLGGVRDEADIRGHRKTYVGAMPGRIITAISQAGSANPLILFDEIDKLCSDIKGDPSSAMLEVLDAEQNNAFRDHFIEVPFDLSKAVFITTANNVGAIPAPLLDRMEVIELPSYTAEEKFHIAKEHLIPKQLKEHGLKASQLKISDDAIDELIQYYTKEAGVRSLERSIASLCRKTARRIAADEVKRVTIKAKDINGYLGIRKYLGDLSSKEDQVGVVNGLAWTSVGGVLMPIEVITMKGTGKIELTGSLGEVMKESSKIAVSYVRSIAEKYGIDPDFYKNIDLHIHAPEGAVPKDGPSAGVTMTTALVSALSGLKVRSDVAMTGEVTLHGKVLPIGGLREKTMAAYKSGIKTVIIPAANKPDLEEVDEVVKNAITFVYAEELTDVLDTALIK
ncbi:endopeptidase La [Ruminococcus flavefaciens]|uniref:Lon protease n=1 Tax=Ruminococcus flavefaciens TaxID=1265 RepID=A0A315Y5J9_RUMFL|nr:endopeptidase La [Ruminococcus flavefaciens]PWJ15268.1 ATP-dependent Lon protease [Ruminococcus flavefaciens]SSA40314.1 ATP-dependent Lon protease [Ruminococcus flavefaciens]